MQVTCHVRDFPERGHAMRTAADRLSAAVIAIQTSAAGVAVAPCPT
jgi:hypothetical protein